MVEVEPAFLPVKSDCFTPDDDQESSTAVDACCYILERRMTQGKCGRYSIWEDMFPDRGARTGGSGRSRFDFDLKTRCSLIIVVLASF
jgi:hypothetical protein